MSKSNSIYDYFLNRIQTIELTKDGIIVTSNNLLFKTTIGQPINEIHPFFEILNDIFSSDNEEIHFDTIQLDLPAKNIIADIVIHTGNEKINPMLLIFDNTKSYDLVQEITQQKNEVFIADFFKSQKLLKNEEEKALKNQFLASITNDLKTPISSVTGLLELFQKSNLTFDQIGLLNIIRASMSHLNRLVSDVLELTKSEMGNLNIEINTFDFDELVQSIEKLFSNKFLVKGIAFKVIKSDRIPKYLVGDRDRVMQILENLLENAYTYTKEGEVIFEIKIDTSSSNKIGLSFIISDTGIGLDENVKDQLFKSFKSKQDNERGGIGLSIVGNLIKLLNGSIKVESKPNKGSRFIVFLLFTIDVNKERKIKNTNVTFKKRNFEHKVNVLLVDDNEINQLVLMKLLINHEGFFIDIANDANKAMEMILKDTYDILFIDLNMKANNGFATIESIRNNANRQIKRLPIICLTSYETEVERKKCKVLKVNEYLVKPYTNQELFEAIYRILKLKALV